MAGSSTSVLLTVLFNNREEKIPTENFLSTAYHLQTNSEGTASVSGRNREERDTNPRVGKVEIQLHIQLPCIVSFSHLAIKARGK